MSDVEEEENEVCGEGKVVGDECADGRWERDLGVLDRGRRDGDVGGCGMATGGVETALRVGASGSIGLALGAGGSIGVGGVGVGDGDGRAGPGCGKALVEKLLSLFLSALGVKDHLLLSMKKTNRFGKVLCGGAQRCQFR